MVNIPGARAGYFPLTNLLALFLVFLTPAVSAEYKARVQAGERLFMVELAITMHQRQRGLMDRTDMPDDAGMLFVMQQPEPVAIWMKNVQFPLDVVWISEQGVVLALLQLEPCKQAVCRIYQPGVNAKYVLEVNKGQFPLNIGDKVEFQSLDGDSLFFQSDALR